MQSLYKRDYTWPTYLSKKGSTHADTLELEAARQGNENSDPCEKERKRAKDSSKDYADKNLQPETFEAVPEYLTKLFQKYPHLHTFYQLAGEEHLMKKIEEEVYKTSYQIDFGKEGFIAQDDYDELIEIAESLRAKRERVCKAEVHGDEGKRLAANCTTEGADPCICDEISGVVKMAMKPISITKMPRAPREPNKKEGADQQSFKGKGGSPDKTKPVSEYRDTIEKLGNIIIKQKLHSRKPDIFM